MKKGCPKRLNNGARKKLFHLSRKNEVERPKENWKRDNKNGVEERGQG